MGLRLKHDSREFTQEDHHRLKVKLDMCLLEAGYQPPESYWSEDQHCYMVKGEDKRRIPRDVLDRARVLVVRSEGMEYSLDEEPGWVGTA